jgi:hypothetical protein
MADREKVIRALRIHGLRRIIQTATGRAVVHICDDCPYFSNDLKDCEDRLLNDVIELLEAQKNMIDLSGMDAVQAAMIREMSRCKIVRMNDSEANDD